MKLLFQSVAFSAFLIQKTTRAEDVKFNQPDIIPEQSETVDKIVRERKELNAEKNKILEEAGLNKQDFTNSADFWLKLQKAAEDLQKNPKVAEDLMKKVAEVSSENKQSPAV